jgi:uncharacterized protein DUF559
VIAVGFDPSTQTVGLPLPLAGEGWGGGLSAIEANGIKVLRFSNHDVMTNRAGVLETIATAVAERAPTLTLPRKRGRERKEPAEKKQP